MSFISKVFSNYRVTGKPKKGMSDRVRDANKEPGGLDLPEKEKKIRMDGPKDPKDGDTSTDNQQDAVDKGPKLFVDDEEQAAPDEPASTQNGLRVGKSLRVPGRIDHLRSVRPYMFIVNGHTKEEALHKFFQSVGGDLDNSKLVESLYAGDLNAPDKNVLTLTFAYIVGQQLAQNLVNKAGENKLAHAAVYFEKNMLQARPFDDVDFGLDLNKALGTGDRLRLVRQLQTNWEALKETSSGSDEEIGGREIAAMQFSTGIPLNYTRFLAPKHQDWKLHIGDRPNGAGRTGLAYIISDKENANVFMKWMKSFNPPANFDDDIYPNPNIDQAFKRVEPMTFNPANCIILTHQSKFNPEEDIPLPSDDKNAITAKFDFLKKDKPREDPVEKNEPKTIKMIDLLTAVAHTQLGNTTTRAGQVIKGRAVHGNVVVHFSQDMKKAILWGSKNAISVSAKDLQEEFPFLKHVDLTFSH